MNTALIDADSIIYIIAWNNRELESEEQVRIECDGFMRDLMIKVQADKYVGVFTPKVTFRQTVAKHKPYKGTRGETPDWVKKWKKVIIDHFTDKWGFFTPDNVEADDVVAVLQGMFPNTIICTPDKDLNQVPGEHYDYKKGTFATVTPEQADRFFWYQMLIGDDADNIAGVPKIGPKKAEELLKGKDVTEMDEIVFDEYVKYFDKYYGRVIYHETRTLLSMLRNPDNFEGTGTTDLWKSYVRDFDLANAQPSEYLASKQQEIHDQVFSDN